MKKVVRSIFIWSLILCLIIPALPAYAAEGIDEEAALSEESTSEESSEEAGPSEESSPEEPSNEEPSNEEPSGEGPSEEEPAAEEPAAEEPAEEEPSGEEPAEEEPAEEEPAAEEPGIEIEEGPQEMAAPELISAEATNGITIVITWKETEGAVSYRLKRNDKTDSFTVEGTTYKDTDGIEPGVKYTYTLFATDADGNEKKAAKTVSATPKLDTPAFKSVASAGYDSIKLTWGKIKGATGYKVYRQKADGNWKKIATVTTTSYTDDGLKTGKKYTYRIRAYYTSATKTVYSEYTDTKTAKPVPSAPKLSSVKQNGLYVNVTWKAVTGATGYKIYRKEEDGSWKLINTRQATAKKKYTDTDVEVGKTYSYRVRAYVTVDKTKEYSSYSEVKDIKVEKPMLELASVTASNNVSLKVKWKEVPGAAGYYIYRWNGEKFAKIGKLTGDDHTYFRDFDAEYGSTHTYTVRAYWKQDGKTVLSAYNKKGLEGTLKYTSKYKGGYKLYYDGEGDLVTEGIWKIIGKRSNYVIKINKKACCITIYASDGDGYNIPVRRCICSPGDPTPIGTFHSISRYRWHELMGPCWGQWCSGIHADFLFHSVMYQSYNNNKNLNTSAYNKLGNIASHGCVRLQAKDAKWIYDNCHVGTKIVIYNSDNPGPLGKPKAPKLKGSHTWDPTDPNMHYLCEKYGCHQNLACD